jgi:hypothetical protein
MSDCGYTGFVWSFIVLLDGKKWQKRALRPRLNFHACENDILSGSPTLNLNYRITSFCRKTAAISCKLSMATYLLKLDFGSEQFLSGRIRERWSPEMSSDGSADPFVIFKEIQ